MNQAYLKNGKQDGVERAFYPNGKLKDEVLFKDGKKNGYFKNYLENGQLKSYALIELDSTKYWEKYNDKNELVKIHRAIKIERELDTLEANKEFTKRVIVSGPHWENVAVTICIVPVGIFKGRAQYQNAIVKNGVATYSTKMDKAGEFYFLVDVTDNRLLDYIESADSKLYITKK